MILHSSDEVAHARANAQRFDWAREQVAAAVARCRPYVEMTDEALWDLVTGQQVPRGIHVNPDLGCPECGRQVYEGRGNYPWIVSLERPFKIECPSCGQVWPRNDFAAFHRSGLGTGGVFDRSRADEALLVGADGSSFAVDDGQGWVDAAGNRWWFVAYYSHYCTWEVVPAAIAGLAQAYLLTGEPRYAHKGLVLLDRVADVYPAMDLRPWSDMGLYNSHGGSGEGRILGCIWETQLSEKLARAADVLLDAVDGDDELLGFLAAKALRWQLANGKSTAAAVRDNIRDGLLREFIASCRDFRIRGNEGMTQTSMAVAAAVLDDPVETPTALDWLFAPGARGAGGGHIPATLIGQVDRDGVGNEASPSYSFIWMNLFRRCAAVLERCTGHRDYDLHRDFPRLRRMYAAPYRLTALDRYTPRIGDTGRTGDPGLLSVDLETALEAFARFGEPWAAQLAYRLNGDRVDGLHTSIFDAEPEAIQQAVQAIVDGEGPLPLSSANLNGYGLTMLRHGEGDERRAAWLYYGRNTGHGHRDRLNYGLYYRGMDLLPELGYPEYADGRWPKRAGWTTNTISHNTAVVNRRSQDPSWVGRCQLFAATEGVSLVEVRCPEVYPETEDYRRTLALIDLSDSESYLVDFLRVAGGDDHVASFHSGDGEVTTGGLSLVEQAEGTYAGAEIAFGNHYDGEPDGRYRGSGFAYLRGVSRQAAPTPGWWVDWDLRDTWGAKIGDAPVHVRYHGLSPVDDVALAWGEPPDNKPGNPEQLRYVLQHNAGAARRSLFAGVVEPYSGTRPNLAHVERLDLGQAEGDLGAAAVRVEAADGRVDVVLSSDDPAQLIDLGHGVAAAGRLVVISSAVTGTVTLVAVAGTRVQLPHGDVVIPRSHYDGTVRDFQRDESGSAWLDVAGEIPDGAQLVGAQLRVLGDSPRDTWYRIEAVSPVPGGARVDVGDTSFVRGFVNDEDYDSGFLYDVAPGDAVEIATLVHCRIAEGTCQTLRATTHVDWRKA